MDKPHRIPIHRSLNRPLAYAATTGSTPFLINLHVGDVGHSLLWGKTRGGKSTLAFMVVPRRKD